MDKKRIDWMQAGAKYVPKEERANFERYIDILEWQELVDGMRVAYIPGEGIGRVIEHYKMQKVSHIAISNSMAPFGLYGIRAHYADKTDVDLIVLDHGDKISSVCAVVTVRGVDARPAD